MMVKKIPTALAFVVSLNTLTAPDCRKTRMICIAPNQARNVSNLFVFRECWEHQGIYQCRSQSMVSDYQPL